jgi:hypothetical protein
MASIEQELQVLTAAVLAMDEDLAGVQTECPVCAGRWDVDATLHERLLTFDAVLVALWFELGPSEDPPLGSLWRDTAATFFDAHPTEDRARRAEIVRVVLRGAAAARDLFDFTEAEQTLAMETQWWLEGTWRREG